MKIPFDLRPSNWGLTPEQKKKKLIEETLSGEALDYALADLEPTDKERSIARLSVDLKYGKLSSLQHDHKVAELNEPDQEKLAFIKLDIDLAHEAITQGQYDHKLADLKNEPYVNVVKIDFDKENPSRGFFELDFNEHFVEYLANSGYDGTEPDEIVNEWFSDLCKNIAIEDMTDADGTAKSYLSDSRDGQLVTRVVLDKDTSEYS